MVCGRLKRRSGIGENWRATTVSRDYDGLFARDIIFSLTDKFQRPFLVQIVIELAPFVG